VSRMNIGRCSLAPRCLYITIDSMSLPLNPISPHHQRCTRTTTPPPTPRVEPMFEVWWRSIANRRRLGALAYTAGLLVLLAGSAWSLGACRRRLARRSYIYEDRCLNCSLARWYSRFVVTADRDS